MSNQNNDVQAILAEMQALREENERLKQAKPAQGGLSITPKGTVRLAGIGVFGLCLYREQWVTLFSNLGVEMPEKLAKFIEENSSKLPFKPEGHKSKFADELKARAAAKKQATK